VIVTRSPSLTSENGSPDSRRAAASVAAGSRFIWRCEEHLRDAGLRVTRVAKLSAVWGHVEALDRERPGLDVAFAPLLDPQRPGPRNRASARSPSTVTRSADLPSTSVRCRTEIALQDGAVAGNKVRLPLDKCREAQYHR